MVKAFFAYALLVIGLPYYIGVIAGAIFMPLAWPVSYPARLAVIQLLNFPTGVLSMLLARGMFYLFGVPAHWARSHQIGSPVPERIGLVFDIQANCAGYSLESLASPASESHTGSPPHWT